ncbi:flagellar transcriptional regulator FlhC [Paenalcaligenes hominis]|uniref:Flagellar transcriptional regulator FlhC n=2 Tax=Paenalcaligenes hominis TaxID=643674 RepID=A0ABX0WT95_9BURK|nr:flagellar transcriptional regulator FlhC [Paenalcaligenes hominis]NJB65991.1 flagellar transcriptional activator FlhC [Paenalcaligenes hominis]GGE71241.1 flagellar transcriptional regulator FlhC [Paenalcaligenes hominis]
MATRSVSQEAKDIELATQMIHLGARLQVLQAETALSYDRLARLYREVRGCSPPKGMLPFSVDWFTTWLPNIHSTLFYSVYCYMDKLTPAHKVNALIEAYKLYLEQACAGRVEGMGEEPVLSFTRAWMLIRFFESGMLQLTQCERCTGQFIAHAHDPETGFVCAICKPPPRAGKTRSSKKVRTAKTAKKIIGAKQATKSTPKKVIKESSSTAKTAKIIAKPQDKD